MKAKGAIYVIKAGDKESDLPISNELITIRKPKHIIWCDGCQSYQSVQDGVTKASCCCGLEILEENHESDQ